MNNHLTYLNQNKLTTRSGGVRSILRPAYGMLSIAGCLLLFSACTPDPPPTLNYKDRQFVDSLFRKEVDSLKPILDSICNLRFDSAVQVAVDSILTERQEEKEKYLERVKKELGQ